MAVQCTGSIAPGLGRIRDFCHRLLPLARRGRMGLQRAVVEDAGGETVLHPGRCSEGVFRPIMMRFVTRGATRGTSAGQTYKLYLFQ